MYMVKCVYDDVVECVYAIKKIKKSVCEDFLDMQKKVYIGGVSKYKIKWGEGGES